MSHSLLVPEESPVDMDTITLDPDEEVTEEAVWFFREFRQIMLLAL